jgi:hypothetical protein
MAGAGAAYGVALRWAPPATSWLCATSSDASVGHTFAAIPFLKPLVRGLLPAPASCAAARTRAERGGAAGGGMAAPRRGRCGARRALLAAAAACGARACAAFDTPLGGSADEVTAFNSLGAGTLQLQPLLTELDPDVRARCAVPSAAVFSSPLFFFRTAAQHPSAPAPRQLRPLRRRARTPRTPRRAAWRAPRRGRAPHRVAARRTRGIPPHLAAHICTRAHSTLIERPLAGPSRPRRARRLYAWTALAPATTSSPARTPTAS